MILVVLRPHHQQVKDLIYLVEYFNMYLMDWHKFASDNNGAQRMNPYD